MTARTVKGRLTADLAAAGTLVIAYPAGYNASMTTWLRDSVFTTGSNDQHFPPVSYTQVFGATGVTLTWKGATLPAGTDFWYSFPATSETTDGDPVVEYVAKIPGTNRYVTLNGVTDLKLVKVPLGVPIAPAAASFRAAAAINGGTANQVLTLLKSVNDVPRNLTFTSAGNDTSKTFTITGTDVYGQPMVEKVTGANAGVAAGKKAFKTVSRITASGDSAGNVSIGHGDVLGIPIYIADDSQVVWYITEEGELTTDNGTVVAGTAGAVQTATTGDVRGTYDPNSACNGTLGFTLVVMTEDPTDIGVVQYAG